MKRSAIAAAVLALGAVFGACDVAQAAVSVSVFVDPGVYGRVAIGGYAEPPQVYADAPVMVDEDGNLVSVVEPEAYAAAGSDDYDDAGWTPAYPEPVFLWVPEYQRLHWAQYCDLYGARGVPVYFVQDGWYRENVMRRHWTPAQRSWSRAQWMEQDRLARLHWEHERWEHAYWDHGRGGHEIVGVHPEWPGSAGHDRRPQPWPASEGGRHDEGWHDGRWHDGQPGNGWHDGRPGSDGHDGQAGNGWHDGRPGNDWRGGQPGDDGHPGRPGNGQPGSAWQGGQPGNGWQGGQPGNGWRGDRDGHGGQDGYDSRGGASPWSGGSAHGQPGHGDPSRPGDGWQGSGQQGDRAGTNAGWPSGNAHGGNGRDGGWAGGPPRSPGGEAPHATQGWNHGGDPASAQARAPQPAAPAWQAERRGVQPVRDDDRGRGPDPARGGAQPVAAWQPVAAPRPPLAPQPPAANREVGHSPDHGDRGEGRDGGGHRLQDR
jgi:hypothetical protein